MKSGENRRFNIPYFHKFNSRTWEGNRGEGESNWVAAVGLKTRYKKDINWVKTVRCCYRVMVTAFEKILTLQSSS
ncbi:hypothetical protein QT982_02235 [Microcoleus sp. herbarium2]